MKVYRAANSKWKFGKFVNRDGAPHYTVQVQGTLDRQHVEQIRPVGDQVPENDFIPNAPRPKEADVENELCSSFGTSEGVF
ncbi:hypothetical protein AVEN_56322-1 [Araneus ventricosus]|uniref:Uncharacterized protein n=1 Tax=Araneus ventricosus TaxID=182803 RepID=A0A4Y2U5N2_ARAVE|nr:hypothetical protein AVEN_56322-1 [Araneus ventricosus]